MMTGILRFPPIMHMTDLNRASLDKYIRSVGVRQIRLACGLVLFAYLLSHFINHALGNISLDALATGVRDHTAFWKSLPIAMVFYAAASAHAGLGIWALYQRRQFHWKAIEPIQLVLGLSIPALIITHLAGVRFDDVLFQHQKLYPQVFYSYWIIWPYKMWLMFIVLIVSWVHGCIGLYFWLRMKAFFKTAAPFLLAAVGAGADPAIRLACQLRPNTDLSFFQIFRPDVTTASLRKAGSVRIGQERYLVSMFVDMRGSTTLAEQRLPFDTVFIVNRFLSAVSQAVIECGGQPNQFVGDGELALFGLNTNPQTACRQALQAAALIATNIDELNRFLSHDLLEPIRFGIGIHGGEVIIGDIGYRDHQVFTALGDAVNVAARLQDMTKGLECEVIVSEEVYETAGLPVNLLPEQELSIRGRAEPMVVRLVANARMLSSPRLAIVA
jgi:class 3 adenylate cyclase